MEVGRPVSWEPTAAEMPRADGGWDEARGITDDREDTAPPAALLPKRQDMKPSAKGEKVMGIYVWEEKRLTLSAAGNVMEGWSGGAGTALQNSAEIRDRVDGGTTQSYVVSPSTFKIQKG